MAGSATFKAVSVERGLATASQAERLLRVGQVAGALRKSSKGGGKGTVDWLEDDATWWLFGLATPGPVSDAAATVPMFMSAEWDGGGVDFRFNGSGSNAAEVYRAWRKIDTPYRVNALHPSNALLPTPVGIANFMGGRTCGTVIQTVLQAVATGELSHQTVLDADLVVSFSLSGKAGPGALVTFSVPSIVDGRSGDRVVHSYAPAIQPSSLPDGAVSRIVREAKFGPEELLIIADLLRDSLLRAGRITSPPDDGSPAPGGKKEGATSPKVTPSSDSMPNPPPPSGGHTHKSQSDGSDDKSGACVCPGNVLEMAVLPPLQPEALQPGKGHTYDREHTQLAA